MERGKKGSKSKTKKCAVCGKAFTPFNAGDECCSPICKTINRVKIIEKQHVKEREKEEKLLSSLTCPPEFDLESNPKARVEWFMQLPQDYRIKFSKCLTPQEVGWARAIAQKSLSEERFYSGITFRKGKVSDNKNASEDDVSDYYDNNGGDDNNDADFD